MPLDAACLTGIVQECRPAVEGARVDKIFQPARDEIVLLLRGNQGNCKLLLTANPSHPRLQLTEGNRENPVNPPMFCMLLRKYLSGARVMALRQPSMERMVDMELETTNEMGDKVPCHLILEAMGRRANLILTDQTGRIVDCLRRIDGDLSQLRPVLPGMFYRQPPQSQGKQNPLTVEPDQLKELLRQAPAEQELTQWILDHFIGLSPLLCREVVYRATGGVDTRFCALREGQLERFAERFLSLCQTIRSGRFQPVALYQAEKPKDFSFLPLGQYERLYQVREFPTFGQMLDAFYGDRERQERVRQKGQELLKTLNNARDRAARKLQAQTKELAATEGRERWRELGDIITSNLYQMERGRKTLHVVDYYDPEGKEIDIPLDPLLTPQKNAAKYYKKYNKAKTASVVLAQQLKKGQRELDYLESVLETVQRAEGERDLAEIRQELEESGYLRAKKTCRKQKKVPTSKPLEFRSSAGLRISVGRNHYQNDALTCRQAYKSDIWLHTQKIHGAHVILWAQGQEPDAQSLTEAAMLAAYYSQAKDGKNVPVDYTPIKYVHKPNGARPGMVIYTTYQTAYVTPDEALVKRLKVK